MSALLVGQAAWALPEGGQIIQGSVQIGQPQNNILQILQSSPTGIINWNSFNIDRNQLVQFLQPGTTSALLNRVIGQDPSQILGQIQANGRILLVNPNGILFGPGSSVNAGSFLATTLSIADQDFLQGRYNLHWDPASPMRAVVNQGDIRVTDGGFIALVSPVVDNQGLLLAERGQVVLGATQQASLTVDARGLLQVTIPDGFAAHSQLPGTPQTVVLTQGQMSDALANLVSHSGQESDRILETAGGIELVGGEGLLINQGTLQAPGGQVLLDSSQVTLNTRSSTINVNSDQGPAGEISVLSAGSAIQDGLLTARSQTGPGGRVELSGRSVGLHSTPLLSPGGRFLIDPTNVSIVASGGDGTNTIDANTLDNGATMTVIADQNLTVDDNVQILLSQPTQLTLQGTSGDVTMRPGSSVNATDNAASLTVIAGGVATVGNVAVSSVNVSGNSVLLTSGQIGTTSGATNLTVNSATDAISVVGTDINVVGATANVSINATNSAFFGANSRFTMNVPIGNLTATGNTTAVLQNTTVQLTGDGNINLVSNGSDHSQPANQSGVFLQEGSLLRGDGVTNITLSAADALVDLKGSIQAPNQLSRVDAQGGRGVLVRTVEVPTIILNPTTPGVGFVQFLTGNLGVAATDTVIQANSPSISLFSNSEVHVRGNRANVTFQSSNDFGFFTGSQLQLDNANANLSVTSPNGGSLDANALIHASGNANITLQGDGSARDTTLGSQASVRVDGAGQINLSNTNRNVELGQQSVLRLGSGNVTLTSSNGKVTGLPNSSIVIDGAGNVTANAPNGVVDFQPGSSISVSDPTGRVSLTSGQDLFTSNLLASNINLHAGGNQFYNAGTLGRAGNATTIDAISDGNMIFLAGILELAGSSVTLNQTTTGFSSFVTGTDVRLSSPSNNQFSINSGTLIGNPGSRLSGSSPAQVTFRGESIGLDGLTIDTPNPASSLNTQSHGVTRLGPIHTGTLSVTTGAFGDQVTAGNVRIIGPWEANSLTISTPKDINGNITLGGSTVLRDRPALIAHQSLKLTANQIYGPIDLPEANLVRALAIATDGTAIVQINVNGSNDSNLGGRAGNIFYYFPQSSNVALNHPAGDVLIYNQPNPNPSSSPGPAPARVISARADLTPSEFSQITSQAAQSQIQLSNLFSAAYLPSTSSVLMLGYNNVGLTHYAPVPLSTPLLELAVLSPGSISPRADASGSSSSSPGPDSSPNGSSGNPSRSDTPTVETGVLSPEGVASRNREDSQRNSNREDQASNQSLAGNDEDEELRYWRRLIEGFIIWEDE